MGKFKEALFSNTEKFITSTAIFLHLFIYMNLAMTIPK
jgi:hypothetical protein